MNKPADLIELYNSGKTYQQISDMIGRSPTFVRARLKEAEANGIEIRQGKLPLEAAAKQKAADLYNSGKTLKEVAEILNLNMSATYKHLQEAKADGITVRDDKVNSVIFPEGANPGNESPIKTKQQIHREYIDLYNKGYSLIEIGKMYGVSYNAVHTRIKQAREKGIEITDDVTRNNIRAATGSGRAIEDFVALRKQGYGVAEIAKALDVSEDITAKLLARAQRVDLYTQKDIEKKPIDVEAVKPFVEAAAQGLTQKQIAKKFKVAAATVFKSLKDAHEAGLNVEPRKNLKKFDPSLTDKIVEVYNQGKNFAKTAEALNLTVHIIERHLLLAKKKGMDVRKESHGSNTAKNPNAVSKALSLYNSGRNLDDVALMTDISGAVIQKHIQVSREAGDWIRKANASNYIKQITKDIVKDKISVKTDETFKRAVDSFNDIVSLKEKKPDMTWQDAVKQVDPQQKDETLEGLFRAAASEYVAFAKKHATDISDPTLVGCKLLQKKLEK